LSVRPVVPPMSGHAAWDDLAAWWLSRFKVSTQRTYSTYLPRWDDLVRRSRDRPAGRPARRHRAWLRSVADSGLSRASVAAHCDAVASIYRRAHDETGSTTTPVSAFPDRRSTGELQRREVLTVLEYAGYLTAARSFGPAHHAIAALGGMMGLRASEMAALAVESLTNVRGYVTLTFIGKGDKPARVPVPFPALPAQSRRCRRTEQRTTTAHSHGRGHGPPDRCTATSPEPPALLASDVPSARTRSAEPSARWGSIKASRCATSSACCATPGPRRPWPATTSTAMRSNDMPRTRSRASSPAGPADRPTERPPGAPLPSRRPVGRPWTMRTCQIRS
jgi:hypothetical protein